MSIEQSQLLPLVFVALAGLATLAIDAFSTERPALSPLTAAFCAMGGLLSALAASRMQAVGASEVWLGGGFQSEVLVLYADVIVALGLSAAALFAGPYLKLHGFERGEFYPLLLFVQLGAMLLMRASGGASFFIALEAMSLALYGLAAFRRRSARSVEAGLKYFISGSLAAALGLLGFALLYAHTGQLSFRGMAAALSAGEVVPLAELGVLLVVASLAFKLAAAPFQPWAPDVYEGSPTVSTLAMATTVKVASVVALYRFCAELCTVEALGEGLRSLPALIAVLAVLSIVVGNFGAFRQRNLKRLAAYSSVAHAGYLLVGLNGILEGHLEATALLWYALAYVLGTVALLGGLIHCGGEDAEAVHLNDLDGAFRVDPLAATGIAVGVLSLIGLPLTPGFFGKLLMIQGGLNASAGSAWLSVALIAGSLLSAGYYLPLLGRLLRRDNESPLRPTPSPQLRLAMLMILLATALVTVAPSLITLPS